MNLPIPSTLRGWLVVIFVLILLFLGYYLCFFKPLRDFYNEKMFYKSTGPLLSGENFRIYGDIPIYLAPFGQRWVYFKVRNRSQHPIHHMSIWMDIQRPDQHTDRQNLPFLFGAALAKPDNLSLEFIPPYGTAHGRLPFYIADPPVSIDAVREPPITVTIWVSYSLFSVPGSPEQITFTAPISTQIVGKVQVNPMRFLAHSFIEQILLPPWSNGFIVFVAFIVCTLVERRVKQPLASRGSWLGEFWAILYPSFLITFYLTGLAFILPYIPWLISDPFPSWAVVLWFLSFMTWLVLKSLMLWPPVEALVIWNRIAKYVYRETRWTFKFLRWSRFVAKLKVWPRKCYKKILSLIPFFIALFVGLLFFLNLKGVYLPSLLRPVIIITTVSSMVGLVVEIFTPVRARPATGLSEEERWKERKRGTSNRPPRYYRRRSMLRKRRFGSM